ncbi:MULTISPECIES: oxidoreductase [Paenibacillus]|uniref:oxidoreductase n=1 Tax=Paenibacillus TaxID=44249 RepID=UPI001E438592|nr:MULTISPECIES: hypothetical protein [Paenibacillus]
MHAVTQQGKDSGSLGIWSDEHISPLQKVVQAIHDQGSKDGLQLWHVGRKGSVAPRNSYICLRVASPQTVSSTGSHTKLDNFHNNRCAGENCLSFVKANRQR